MFFSTSSGTTSYVSLTCGCVVRSSSFVFPYLPMSTRSALLARNLITNGISMRLQCRRWLGSNGSRAALSTKIQPAGTGDNVVDCGSGSITREGDFVGVRDGATLTHTPHVHSPRGFPQFDIFQLMDNDGNLVEGAQLPNVAEETMVRMYKSMVTLQEMDVVFQATHRQGRISFYMTSTGEEAAMIGSAAALSPTDQVRNERKQALLFS